LQSYGGLSRKTLKKYFFFCFTENLQNSVRKGLIASPIDVLCSNFVKFGRRKIGKSGIAYSTKNKILPGSPTLATVRIAPKICQGQPPRIEECTQSAPDFIQIGSLSAELYWNARTPSKGA